MPTYEKFKWNRGGFRELRKSREVMSELVRHANAILATAGPGYDKAPFMGKNRARVSVTTDSLESERDNAINNTLVRAIGASAGDVTAVTAANDGKFDFVTKSGKTVRATHNQILNWTKND